MSDRLTQDQIDTIVLSLKESLSDIDGLECYGEFKDVAAHSDAIGLGVKITINGREYGHAIISKDQRIDYAPLFRGWHAELMERLAKDDNRPKAA